MAAMLVEGRRQARYCEAFSGNAGTSEDERLGHPTPGTRPGPNERGFVIAIASVKLQVKHRNIAFTSSGASICGRRSRPIHKKIIGRGVCIFRETLTRGSVFLHLLRAFLLLHQPARQHGCGVFLDPKVEQRADLLAEIGGMVEPREFIALQRVPRSRKKKLPRRLSLVVVHGGLLEERLRRLIFRKIESRVPIGYFVVESCGKLWRSDEETAIRHGVQGAVYSINGARGGNELRACSACAGDYEDPDRTAWPPDDAEDGERAVARRPSTEKFPAEE